jgi:soluble lytic murein transglycosylase-like protein
VTVAAIESPAPAAPALAAQDAVARVAELRQLIAHARTGSVPPSNGGASFPAALAGATGAQAATTAAAPYGPAGTSAAAGLGTTAAGGPGATPYDGLIAAAAQRHGVDPALLHGLVRQESGFDPSATSSAGAQGLCQLMPGTAAALGVTNPLDPAQSIDGGARYLRQQLDAFGGDPALALAAYNAGPGAVRRYGGVPPYAETQAYVQKVTANANAYRAAQGAGGLAPSGAGIAPPYAGGAPIPATPLPPTSPPYSIT